MNSDAASIDAASIDAAAKAAYDANPIPQPTWEQLGDTTKSVWRELVAAKPSTLAKETIESVNKHSPCRLGYGTSILLADTGIQVAVVAGTLGALRHVVNKLSNLPFDPRLCHRTVVLLQKEVTLDEEL